MSKQIAVDFDGVLAEYHGFEGDFKFGKPVQKMIDFAKSLIDSGNEVVIFTARATTTDIRIAIQNWDIEAGLPPLEVTNIKRKEFHVFYDDRAYHVLKNTGTILTGFDNNASKTKESLSTQVDGNHYSKMKIQPIEFAHANKLGAIEAAVLKYICRHGNKNGKVDLEKAKHLIDILIDLEYNV
jgi:hypothetical protein